MQQRFYKKISQYFHRIEHCVLYLLASEWLLLLGLNFSLYENHFIIGCNSVVLFDAKYSIKATKINKNVKKKTLFICSFVRFSILIQPCLFDSKALPPYKMIFFWLRPLKTYQSHKKRNGRKKSG